MGHNLNHSNLLGSGRMAPYLCFLLKGPQYQLLSSLCCGISLFINQFGSWRARAEPKAQTTQVDARF